MTDVVITAAKRTPVGSFLGAFAATPAHELGRVAISAALAQANVAPEELLCVHHSAPPLAPAGRKIAMSALPSPS